MDWTVDWTVDSGQWTVDSGQLCVAEMPSTFLLGTLFRAAIGRASGRVTAIRAWQAQHHLRTPNFLTVHSPHK